jgi:hypothetical protein
VTNLSPKGKFPRSKKKDLTKRNEISIYAMPCTNARIAVVMSLLGCESTKLNSHNCVKKRLGG